MGLDSDIPAYLSKRQITNKAINNFLENVRNKKLNHLRRPAGAADAEVSNASAPNASPLGRLFGFPDQS